jgi:hypothetical protein
MSMKWQKTERGPPVSAKWRCARRGKLLGSGFMFTQPGNREVTWLEAAPFLSPSTGSGVKGRISSNSGGSAEGQVMAICLR